MNDIKNSAEVLIVHAIDTEGPLYESFDAKFDRLNDLFNINHKPNKRKFFKVTKWRNRSRRS